MPVRQGPPQPAPPPRDSEPTGRMPPFDRPMPYPAGKARGGEIILRTPARRFVFIAGLIGMLVVALLAGLFA